jgi:hypothetical protein
VAGIAYQGYRSDGGSIALIAASKHSARINAMICEALHIFVEDVTLKGIYESIEAYDTTNLLERLAKYHSGKVDTLLKPRLRAGPEATTSFGTLNIS